MANVVAGKVSVSLVADTARYVNEMKKTVADNSKSMKKMQRDMDKMQKGANKSFKKTSMSFKNVATAAVAVGVAMGVMIGAASKARLEHEQLAKAAGMTGDQFDNVAFAFSSVGIEAESASDMLRDLNIKIGEAAALGSGPAAEAMKLLGISMASIKDKSPEEQLLAINKAMDDMNVSGIEQRAIFDSLGSDLDKLSPLLKNGAAGYKKLKAEAERLDVKIPQAALTSIADLGKYSQKTGSNFEEFGAYLGSFFAGTMESITKSTKELIQGFIDWNEQSNFLSNTINYLTGAFGLLKDTLDIVYGVVKAFFLGFSFAAEALFDTLRFHANNFKSNFLLAFKAIKIGATIAFAAMKKTVFSWVKSVGEMLSNIPGLGDLGKKLIDTADQAIAANQAVIAQQKKDYSGLIDDNKKRFLDFAEMRKLKELEFVAEQKANALAIVANAKEIGSTLMGAGRVVLGLPSAEGDTPTAEGSDDSASSGEDPQVKALADLTAGLTDYQRAIEVTEKAQSDFNNSTIGGYIDSSTALAGALDKDGKAYALAAKTQALIQGYEAIMGVWADPTISTYAKIPATIMVAAKTAQTIGQFHGGTDEVPDSMDNKSFLLKAGERVVQPKANKDLTRFLKNGDSGSGAGNISISAPVTISGNVTDKAWFQSELYKHRQMIADSVSKSNRERPRRY
jgi:hypothetical protein